MKNVRLDESQAKIKIFRGNINFRYADDTTLMEDSENELKRLLMRGTEESKRVGLKLNFKKTKILACGLISSSQTEGKKVEAVTDFPFLGSKITGAMK